MSAESRLRLAFALGAAVVAGLGIAGVVNARQYSQTNDWVEHTQVVEREIALANAAASRLFSAGRGFVLYRQQVFLDREAQARAALLAHVEAIARLTADNPRQQANVAAVRSALDVAFAAEANLLDSAVRRSPLPSAPLSEIDTVRERLDTMMDEEERLMHERVERSHNLSQRGLVVAAVLIAALSLAVGALFLRVRKDLMLRRRSEDEARRSSLFLDTMIESLPLMIFVKDAERLAFTRINRAGEKLLGVERADLLGRTDFDFFPPDQARFFQDKDRATLRTGQMVEIGEEPIETAAGRRFLHTRKVPLVDADGTPLFLLGISEDVTEQKRAQEELRRAKEAAEATSRELETFSYSVSHDLRAPLRAIDGFSSALLEEHLASLDEKGRDYLQRVRRAALRMNELIDALLELSRVSRRDLQRTAVDVSALARDVLDELSKRDAAREVAIVVAPGLTAQADARLLRAVVENLLGNAWKFTAKKERARIEVGAADGAFFVRDDGAGFDMAYADKLFGAFQRLHNKQEFEGSGIGLATVQRIVLRHGGRIWAEAAPGKGATFYFTLG